MQCGDYDTVVVCCDAVKRNVMVSCYDDAKEWLSVVGVTVRYKRHDNK